MDIRYQKTTSATNFVDAFDMGLLQLHTLTMSDECGIEHYKTDFLHDIVRITQHLTLGGYVTHQNDDYYYRTVIGTRNCGTWILDSYNDSSDVINSTIARVGISIQRENGKCTVHHVMLKPDEVKDFLRSGVREE